MESTGIVIVTLVIYQLVLLGVGLWARRRATTAEGYLIGDRGLGPWVASLSYAAGSSSAWSILGVSGIAFSQGLSSVWLIPGTLTGHVIVWFVIAPWLQREAHAGRWVTLTDVLTQGLASKTTVWVSRLSALIILFSFTFYIAAQFQGAADLFTSVFNFNFVTALVIGAVVVLLYTFWGGFWAVSLTDALQAGLMFVTALIFPAIALYVVMTSPDVGTFSAQHLSLTGAHEGWFLIGMLLGSLSIGFGPLGQPHLLNRVMALRSPDALRSARVVALIWFVVVLGGMYTLGLCGHVLVGAAEGEQIFFALADSLLPPVIAGVFLAAVLSAIMSTADSQLLVAAGAVSHDLRLRINTRVATVAVAAAAVALAAFLPESIFSRVLFAWNALGAAFGPAVIARLLGWRGREWGVPLSMLLGFGLTVLFYSLPNGPGDLWERAVPFLIASVTLYVTHTSNR